MENIKYIHKVSILREDIVVEEDSMEAVPLKLSGNLMLVLYLYDFISDGYKILCLEDITECKKKELDKFHNYILQQQGVINNIDRIENLNIDSWKNVFCYMHDNEVMLDISLEKTESGRNFFVGKVEEVNDDNIMFREFTTLGIKKNKRKRLFYNDITLVSFGNKYSEMLDKYGTEYADYAGKKV